MMWLQSMSSNVYQYLFNKKRLELTVQDTQDNLQEFMHMIANGIDTSTFDIISITRTDAEDHYTQSFKHPRVTTQSARIAYQSAEIIPLPKRAQG